MELRHTGEEEEGEERDFYSETGGVFPVVFLQEIERQNGSDGKDIAASDGKSKKGHLLHDEQIGQHTLKRNQSNEGALAKAGRREGEGKDEESVREEEEFVHINQFLNGAIIYPLLI